MHRAVFGIIMSLAPKLDSINIRINFLCQSHATLRRQLGLSAQEKAKA